MSHVSEVALNRALAMLNAINAKYKVILPDGTEHGELVVVQPKQRGKRQKGPYEYGALRNYFVPIIKDMKAGDACEIPFDKFDKERLRGAISGWSVHHWGKGSNITTINNDRKCVEILRVT